MKHYAVITTKTARRQLREIVMYHSQESPEYAELISAEIESAIDSSAEMPERFSKVAKSRKRQLVVHRMVVSPYLIYFRVETNSVFVTMVRHEKRRPLKRYD